MTQRQSETDKSGIVVTGAQVSPWTTTGLGISIGNSPGISANEIVRHLPTTKAARRKRCMAKLTVMADNANPSASTSTERTTFTCLQDAGHEAEHAQEGFVPLPDGTYLRYLMTWKQEGRAVFRKGSKGASR